MWPESASEQLLLQVGTLGAQNESFSEELQQQQCVLPATAKHVDGKPHRSKVTSHCIRVEFIMRFNSHLVRHI